MNRMYVVAGLLLLVCLAASGACAKKRAAKPTKTPQAASPAKAAPTGEVKELAEFRYERYEGGKCVVYNASAKRCYYRLFGSLTGYDYAVDGTILKKLAPLSSEVQSSGIEPTPLEQEDKCRDRWIIELKGTDGKVFSIIGYDLGGKLAKDIAEKVDKIFLEQVSIINNEEEHLGEYSESKYNAKGELRERIDYLPDGTVMGGYDPEDPIKEY